MKQIIGLTGPSGAGKSAALKEIDRHRFEVIDCDALARRAVEKGSLCLRHLCEIFGDRILWPDGTLNRAKLAEIAFSSPERTQQLNDTVLPVVLTMVLEEIAVSEADAVILDAPTLIQSGLTEICSTVIVVLADRAVRLQRIMQRDSLTRQQAETRLNAALPDEEYRQAGDYVLYNNTSQKEFAACFANTLKEITEELK